MLFDNMAPDFIYYKQYSPNSTARLNNIVSMQYIISDASGMPMYKSEFVPHLFDIC